MIRQILYMSVLWTTLIFIGYNLLTTTDDNKTNMTIPNEAEGSTEKFDCSSINERDDYFYCDEFDWEPYVPDREIVEEMCDASEDYAKNPKNCDKAYDLVEKAEKEEQEREDKKLEDICDDVDGKWTKDGCETDHDGPKADKFEEKVTELHQQEQESEPEQIIEDWRNTVEVEEEKEPEQIIVEEWEKHHGSPGDDVKIASPIPMTIIENNDDDDDKEEKEEESEYEEVEEEESDESSEEEEDEDSGGGEDEE